MMTISMVAKNRLNAMHKLRKQIREYMFMFRSEIRDGMRKLGKGTKNESMEGKILRFFT